MSTGFHSFQGSELVCEFSGARGHAAESTCWTIACSVRVHMIFLITFSRKSEGLKVTL